MLLLDISHGRRNHKLLHAQTSEKPSYRRTANVILKLYFLFFILKLYFLFFKGVLCLAKMRRSEESGASRI